MAADNRSVREKRRTILYYNCDSRDGAAVARRSRLEFGRYSGIARDKAAIDECNSSGDIDAPPRRADYVITRLFRESRRSTHLSRSGRLTIVVRVFENFVLPRNVYLRRRRRSATQTTGVCRKNRTNFNREKIITRLTRDVMIQSVLAGREISCIK